MKKCNQCGALADDQTRYCTLCGSSEFTAAETAPAPQTENAPAVDINDNGNIIAGIVGAFLFSLLGGLLYFLIYQLNVIAGICGLAIFVLANFGYGLFAKTKNKGSIVALIVSLVMMGVTIYLAEYLCLSFEIYKSFKASGITFMDAVDATPEFLTYPELHDAFVEDLVFAYIFGFLASIGNISNIIKARKNK